MEWGEGLDPQGLSPVQSVTEQVTSLLLRVILLFCKIKGTGTILPTFPFSFDIVIPRKRSQKVSVSL